TDGRPARAACAATELARLPVEAQATRVKPSPRAAVSATDTTRSLNEWVGLAESSLTHSGACKPISAASASAGTSGVSPGSSVTRDFGSCPTGSRAAYRHWFGGPAAISSRVTAASAAGSYAISSGPKHCQQACWAARGYSVPQPRQIRARAGLSDATVDTVMVRPSSHLPHAVVGRSWHLSRSASASSRARWLPGCHRAVPSTPLDEYCAVVGPSVPMISPGPPPGSQPAGEVTRSTPTRPAPAGAAPTAPAMPTAPRRPATTGVASAQPLRSRT